MFSTTEIADRIYRISMFDEADVAAAGLVLPGSYNMFVIASDEPALINTMMRKTFDRFHKHVSKIIDPSSLRYLVVSHQESDTLGAINEWLAVAPRAVPLSTELCAVLLLRDLSNRDVRTVGDEEVLDLGSHRLRFLHSPYINQWDSMLVHEEVTATLFPNDLFACPAPGDVLDNDPTDLCLMAAREFGYMPNDRACLNRALNAIEKCAPRQIAPMHGPVLTTGLDALVDAFRTQDLTPTST